MPHSLPRPPGAAPARSVERGTPAESQRPSPITLLWLALVGSALCPAPRAAAQTTTSEPASVDETAPPQASDGTAEPAAPAQASEGSEGASPGAAASAPADAPPVPPAAAAQTPPPPEACPTEGMVRTARDPSLCCWPGQSEAAGLCIGTPQCPEGAERVPGGCQWPDASPQDSPASAPASQSDATREKPPTGLRLTFLTGIRVAVLPDVLEPQAAALVPLRLEVGYRFIRQLSFSVGGFWAGSVWSFSADTLQAHGVSLALNVHGGPPHRRRGTRNFILSLRYLPLLRYQFDGSLQQGSGDEPPTDYYPAFQLQTQGFELQFGKEWSVMPELAVAFGVGLGATLPGKLEVRPAEDDDGDPSLPSFSLSIVVGATYTAWP